MNRSSKKGFPMRDAKEDPDLTQVKAVLKRLQRLDQPAGDGIDLDHFEPMASHNVENSPAHLSPVKGIGVFDRKRAAIDAIDRPTKPRRRHLALVAGACVAAAGTAALFAIGAVKIPSEWTEGAAIRRQQKQDEASLLADARRLLSAGDVILARKRLLAGAPESQAELAFMLAQSYDPNYVRTLATANGLPDRAEAERWYKKWYELAVGSGLEMDNGRLKRIINAMQ
jgi:hypothetical protein